MKVMKHLKYNILGLVFGISLITSGCSDWLEMQPYNSSYGEGFWVSEEAAQQTLAGGYALLRNAITKSSGLDYFHHGDMNAQVYYTFGYSNQVKFWEGGFWNPNFEFFKWDRFFKVVAQVNLILYEVPKLDVTLFQKQGMTTEEAQASKDRYIGEALFLRAYTYFYMTRIWGGSPLVTEATSTVSQVITDDGYVKLVPRNTEEEVINQVIADCKEAEGLLDYDTPGSSTWGIQGSKGSVQALMAHAYAWRGEYAEAEKAAAAVITDGPYELVDYVDSLAVVKMFEGRSSEAIFEINLDYEQSESNVNGLFWHTAYTPYVYGKNRNNGTWVVMKNSQKQAGGGRSSILMGPLYDENDIRTRRFYGFWNTQPYPILLKYVHHKYEDEGAKLRPHATSNYKLFRLSGIKLLHAEALAYLNRDGEALAVLNEIRERAQANPFVGLTGDDLKQEIFYERHRELIGEGHLWYDRIRLKKFEDMPWMTPYRIESQGYYWPIPLDFIINNPLLKQNPFWSRVL